MSISVKTVRHIFLLCRVTGIQEYTCQGSWYWRSYASLTYEVELWVRSNQASLQSSCQLSKHPQDKRKTSERTRKDVGKKKQSCKKSKTIIRVDIAAGGEGRAEAYQWVQGGIASLWVSFCFHLLRQNRLLSLQWHPCRESAWLQTPSPTGWPWWCLCKRWRIMTHKTWRRRQATGVENMFAAVEGEA
jgi:hypothetical protein